MKHNFNKNLKWQFFLSFVIILSGCFAEARMGGGPKKASRFKTLATGSATLTWQTSTAWDPNIWMFEAGYTDTYWTINLTNTGTQTSGIVSVAILANTIHFALLDGCSGVQLAPGGSCSVTVSLLTAGMAYGTIYRTLRATQNGINSNTTLYACDNFTC